MDPRIASLLESLLLNVQVVNGELERLLRNEQFTDSAESLRLARLLREAYMRGLEMVKKAEG